MQPSEALALRIPNSKRNTIIRTQKHVTKLSGVVIRIAWLRKKSRRKGHNAIRDYWPIFVVRDGRFLSHKFEEHLGKARNRIRVRKKEHFVKSLSFCAWFIYCTRVKTCPCSFGKKKSNFCVLLYPYAMHSLHQWTTYFNSFALKFNPQLLQCIRINRGHVVHFENCFMQL